MSLCVPGSEPDQTATSVSAQPSSIWLFLIKQWNWGKWELGQRNRTDIRKFVWGKKPNNSWLNVMALPWIRSILCIFLVNYMSEGRIRLCSVFHEIVNRLGWAGNDPIYFLFLLDSFPVTETLLFVFWEWVKGCFPKSETLKNHFHSFQKHSITILSAGLKMS